MAPFVSVASFSLRGCVAIYRWPHFHYIWDGDYATGALSKIVVFSFLQSVTSTWRMLKVMRWGHDDAIIRDPLRIRGDINTFLRQWPWIPLLSCYLCSHCCSYFVLCLDDDVRLFSCNNSRMIGRIFMKFGIDVMPLLPSLKFYFFLSFSRKFVPTWWIVICNCSVSICAILSSKHKH
jgi:hypothetical protein